MSINFSFKRRYQGFDLDLDHCIATDRITGIYGPSGSGKTSLLRLIAGLDKSLQGRISFNAQRWQTATNFIDVSKRRLGFVFQEPSLFEHMSVRGNLNYAIKRAVDIISFERAVELTEIKPLLDRQPASLSGGEKQRVAIARALCSSPQLLLMDEPLAALDRASKQRILTLIEKLSVELALPVVYVSHALDEVARLSDELILMRSGKIVGSGDIHTMLTHLDYPLARSVDAEALIEAQIAEHDAIYKLTYLTSRVGRFAIAQQNFSVGESVKLMLAARDVSITKERQENTSVLNIFAANVDELVETSESQVTVRLIANGTPVLARITKKSAALLNLTVGDSVFLQAKTVALL